MLYRGAKNEFARFHPKVSLVCIWLCAQVVPLMPSPRPLTKRTLSVDFLQKGRVFHAARIKRAFWQNGG